MPKRPLVFVHVPKTAGRSFISVLKRVYSQDRIYKVYGNISDRVSNLRSLSREKRRNIDCVVGHYKFGLHEELPDPATYVTFLRDPVERVVSHYYYVRRFPGHRLNSAITDDGASLRDYVDLDPELRNGQARLIAGGNADTPHDELRDRALENMRDRFSGVGVADRFDASVTVMAYRLGWPSNTVYYRKQNVSKSRPSLQEIEPGVRNYIESKNKVDRELYETATEWLDQHVEEIGTGFKRRMRRMKAMSAVYGSYRSLRSTVGRLIQPLLSYIS
nr:sulfotransferase family 2 domain-containing protein [Salinibacter ruber]